MAEEPVWPRSKGSRTSRDLGVLEVADLDREALDGATGDGDGGQERGVAVALHDLRAHGVRDQAQARQGGGLDLRRQLRVGAHRPRDLAGGQVVGRGAQAGTVTVELEGPRGQLQPERQRLGVDTVGAAHLQRAGVLARPGHDGADGSIEALQDEVGGGATLQGQAGVDDIGAGQAVVQEAAFVAHRLGDLGDEGDHVVVGRQLQLMRCARCRPGLGLR